MPFEFDPVKSAANRAKHGLDFVQAQAIWQDENRLEITAFSSTEPRFQVLGLVAGKLWSAFITYRNHNIRLISVRRARKNEHALYHEK